jgi:hypothetical protein
MTPEELAKREEEEFSTGPLSVLTQSVKNNTQVVDVGFFGASFCKLSVVNGPCLLNNIV